MKIITTTMTIELWNGPEDDGAPLRRYKPAATVSTTNVAGSPQQTTISQ
jgi:hypothetical protein